MMVMARRAAGDLNVTHIPRQELIDTMVSIFLCGLLSQPAAVARAP
jgi:hypothetical protein